MATHTRVRAQSRRANLQPRAYPKHPPATTAIGRTRDHLTPWRHKRSISPNTQRQLLGAVPVFTGLISGWVLVTRGSDGMIAHWWHESLRTLGGEAAFVIPILLIIAGVKAIAS